MASKTNLNTSTASSAAPSLNLRCLRPSVGSVSSVPLLDADQYLECLESSRKAFSDQDYPMGSSLVESIRESLLSGVVDASLGVMDGASAAYDAEDSDVVDPTVDWTLDRLQRAEALRDLGVDKALRDHLTAQNAPNPTASGGTTGAAVPVQS